ncbi:MAG TPA: chemotaxis protein CheB [Mucilaginibacter sp.]|nr:chemotaxis protein CheB [Mucilaginibacter sp.]
MPVKQPTIKKKAEGLRRFDNYVVAIGASAGGLEAIHEFFDHMPASSSLSFVVIQHLSSDYKSLLVELVSKHTHMKVFEAENNMTLQHDCVYIIPNNKLMTLKNGKLRLADKTDNKVPNTAIDTFLHTLAGDKKEKAIAIILSGTGSDGTKGIESIKEQGGMVMVQEPGTAKFDGMPNSAITSGNADFILPPQKMHEELFKYIKEEPAKLLENGKINDALLDEIFKLVYENSGNDFNLYKTPTIIRRISRRMNETGARDLSSYVALLRESGDEVKTLGKDFLIGVTKFFRDKAAFDFLAEKVIPDIVESKEDNEILKVWVCACSTGEEAYSIAILINEYLDRKGRKLEVKIFATDIDDTSIDIASKNQYPLTIAKEIQPARLKKYFIKEGKYYSIVPSVRKQIVFARHDVIKSPPFIKNDLITCRNMLIYMNNLLQHKVLSTFHFSLNQGGYLFLGSSETANVIKEGLIEVNGKWKIFKKSGYIAYSIHNYYHINRSSVGSERKMPQIEPQQLPTIEKDFNDFMVGDLGYVGVYIDKSYIIQEAIGNYRQFLTLPEKKIELNILKMVPHEVSVVLTTAVRKAWKDNKKTHVRRIRLKRGEEECFLNISIRPPAPETGRALTLIVLCESAVEIPLDKDQQIIPALPDEQNSEYMFELEAELNETRNNLQMAIEEMETTNEELQSSNEELLSANEELQSSNEELQSLNEELHTLNTEHQLKIKELTELNDDLDNYFRSIDVGLIFLDSSLVIRKFNRASVNMVNLIESDIGRSIEQITNNIRYENLTTDIRAVISGNKEIEKEIVLNSSKRMLMRIIPYIRKDQRVDGVIITFVDISLVIELNNIINGVFNSSISAIMAFVPLRDKAQHITDFKCISFNNQALTMLGRSREELNNATLLKQLRGISDHIAIAKFVGVVEDGNILQAEYEDKDGKWYQAIAVKMDNGFAATFTDITRKKHADQKLKRNYNELINTRESLRKLNDELEDKVADRTRKLFENEERFSQIMKASNDTIWDWDLVNNRMWRSENFTPMFGHPVNEDTQNINFWFANVHPDDRDRVSDSVYEAINNGNKQWSAEYLFKKSDGSYAVILDRGSILHDDFGTPYRMVGSIVDITRLVETEKKLSSSETRFRKIFEANVIGILFSNMETGDITDANEAFLGMTGYTRDDLENGLLNWQKITPKEYLSVSMSAVNQLKQSGVCPPFEKSYIRKDGKEIPVMIGSAILGADILSDVVTYVIDISNQKQIERRRNELQRLVKKQQDEFYSVFRKAPALISIRRGKDLRYEFVNEALENLNYGVGIIGRPFLEVHPDLKGSELDILDKKVMTTGETVVVKALKIDRKDLGSESELESWFDCILTPVFNDEGQIDGVAFFGFDVTDLFRAQRATKELMQKKDEFMSIASHELKTPITSIKGSLQLSVRLAQKGATIEKIMPFIDKSNRQINKLTALVDDLLDVTKIQSGKLVYNFSRFSINELIAECVDEIQPELSGFGIEMNMDHDVELYADRNRIEQVIINFLSNAIKYSPTGSRIVLKTAAKDGEKLRLSVKDFGIGIPEDKKPYVFDRFFRVQESSTKFSGLGLGLYISSEIIKRHHGEIGVISELDKGSEFWFEIPV